jgi:hypothetical protein
MVVVHHLPYPRLLVFCGSVVVPTVVVDTPSFCDALLFIPRLYPYHLL